MNTRPLIIDTDPGIDDAIALAMLMFDPRIDIKLISTVGGNVGVDLTTRNVLNLLTFWGKRIPVAKGATKPIIRKVVSAASIHGDSGMDGYDFPEADTSLLTGETAVEAMHRVVNESDTPVTIMCIGPLTNLALLLRVFPDDSQKIAEVVFMGGSTERGNLGVLSEFNAGYDPEATSIVVDSGLKLTMVPLDVGWKALVFPEDSARIKDLNRTGAMLAQLLGKYRGRGMRNGLRMYDGCAAAYILAPELFTVDHLPVTVELRGELTAGATLVDMRGYLGKEANVDVTLDIDAAAFTEHLLAQLSLCN